MRAGKYSQFRSAKQRSGRRPQQNAMILVYLKNDELGVAVGEVCQPTGKKLRGSG